MEQVIGMLVVELVVQNRIIHLMVVKAEVVIQELLVL
tara:strand:+ start:570 stop:680 length:111 start_codon:yes stop_codon:yes gene_type:complete